MPERGPHESELSAGLNKKTTLTYDRLESLRLKKLGLNPVRYSRYMSYNNSSAPDGPSGKQQGSKTASLERYQSGVGSSTDSAGMNNSLAPFYTTEKPTCGYFFSRTTDNKKRNFGIPASDLVSWRSIQGGNNAGAMTAR